MHEVFLTRGDVQMAPPWVQELIHTRVNCINIHSACHPAAHNLVNKRECAKYILYFEGYDDILDWLLEMHQLLKGSQARLEIIYLDNLVQKLIKSEIEL